MAILDLVRTALYGDPPSLDYEPSKEGLLRAFEELVGALDGLAGGAVAEGAVVYTTRALLYGNLTPVNNSLGLVYNDPNPDLNGVYIKIGATGAGSWSFTGLLGRGPAPTNAQIEAVVNPLLGPYVDAAELAADNAANYAKGIPQNIGSGVDSIGAANFEIPADRRRAFTVSYLDGQGGKTDVIVANALRDEVTLCDTVFSLTGTNTPKMTARNIELVGDHQLVPDTGVIIAPDQPTRNAFSLPYVGLADTVEGVFRAALLPAADSVLPDTALVRRGNTVGIVRTPAAVQLLHKDQVCVVYQGSAMEAALPIAGRTHQLVPAITRTDGYLYAVWYAINGVNDAVYPASEAAGNYCVVARRPLTGGSWVEVARIAPADMANGRCYDPVIGTTSDGRVVILWAFSALGTRIYHWSAGTHLTVLENPDIDDGGRFVFTPPEFVDHGVPSPPFLWRGDFCLPIDVWQRTANFPTGNTTIVWDPYGPVVKGARLFRLGLNGERPWAEAISGPTPSVSPYDDFSETQMVPLDGGRILAHQRTTDGIRSFIASDSTLKEWDGPTDIESDVGGMTTPVRTALIRTLGGNLAWAGNNSGPNRWNMTLRLSQDADGEGGTFLWKSLVLDPSTGSPENYVTYPGLTTWRDPVTGRAKIGATWDLGRGLGVGFPAIIRYTEVFEDEVVAGTASVTLETISSI